MKVNKDNTGLIVVVIVLGVLLIGCICYICYDEFVKKDLENKELVTTFLKNDVNDVKIILDKEKVTLLSEGSINLVDAQLNELLLSYKSMYNNKLKVSICENCKEYDY